MRGIPENWLTIFWRDGAAVYLPRYRSWKDGHYVFSWAAAFWSFFWFFAHGMAGAGLVLLGVFMGVEHVLTAWGCAYGLPGWLIFLLPMFVMAPLTGFIAYPLYFSILENRMRGLSARYEGAEEGVFLQVLRKQRPFYTRRVAIVFGVLLALATALMVEAYLTDPQTTLSILATAFSSSCAQ